MKVGIPGEIFLFGIGRIADLVSCCYNSGKKHMLALSGKQDQDDHLGVCAFLVMYVLWFERPPKYCVIFK